MLEYRKAKPEEEELVWAIIEDGREALANLGLDQWQGLNPSREGIHEDVTNGITRVAVEDGVLLGALAYCEGIEPDYENNVLSGQWLTAEPNYVAFHRVATGKAAVRKGVCSFLIQSAIKEAKESGAASVRIDTHAGNLPMQGSLKKNGFIYCCEITLSDPFEPTKHRIGFEQLI